jgi:hypothetical protein
MIGAGRVKASRLAAVPQPLAALTLVSLLCHYPEQEHQYWTLNLIA